MARAGKLDYAKVIEQRVDPSSVCSNEKQAL